MKQILTEFRLFIAEKLLDWSINIGDGSEIIHICTVAIVQNENLIIKKQINEACTNND